MSTRARLLVSIAGATASILALAPGSAIAGGNVLGIDVSRFNGTIDWAQVAQSRVQFAFVQASRGSGADCAVKPDSCGADPLYDLNYANARAAGVRVGPYHRAFAGGGSLAAVRADAATEATIFADSVETLAAGDLRPVVDVETPFGGLSPKQLRTWVRVWIKRVRARLGAMPIIYTNATSWRATGNTVEFARAGSPLWVAHWSVRKPALPANNWNRRGWSVWQFTSSGRIAGINGRVDLNRLRGGFRAISFG
jgi:GH25 family lysozyme M1 (1,4-beta-N-acetylmuramidase)